MRYTQWQIAPSADLSPGLLALTGGHPLVARLLAQRGLADVARARAFWDPAHYGPSSPDELPDMPQAMALIHETIAQAGLIRIWGDFDTDGQTATALLWETLQALQAQVDYRQPHSKERPGNTQQVSQQARRPRCSF